jgi:hypothetical protein
MAIQDIRFESQGSARSGTLTRPEGAVATVLMVHGTGPLDRDENMRGQRLDIFNALAEALARAQIARATAISSPSPWNPEVADLVRDWILRRL